MSAVASAGLAKGGVLRFFRDDGTGVCTACGVAIAAPGTAAAAAVVDVELEEAAWLAAACRVDDRVTLEDGDVCVRAGASGLKASDRDGVVGGVDVGDEGERAG